MTLWRYRGGSIESSRYMIARSEADSLGESSARIAGSVIFSIPATEPIPGMKLSTLVRAEHAIRSAAITRPTIAKRLRMCTSYCPFNDSQRRALVGRGRLRGLFQTLLFYDGIQTAHVSSLAALLYVHQPASPDDPGLLPTPGCCWIGGPGQPLSPI